MSSPDVVDDPAFEAWAREAQSRWELAGRWGLARKAFEAGRRAEAQGHVVIVHHDRWERPVAFGPIADPDGALRVAAHLVRQMEDAGWEELTVSSVRLTACAGAEDAWDRVQRADPTEEPTDARA